MSGFRRVGKRRHGRRGAAQADPAEPVVVGVFAPIEVALIRQFVAELMLLLEAEVGARPAVDEDPADRGGPAGQRDLSDQGVVDDVFAALTGLGEPPSGPVPITAPEDPVLARLLPDAYADDAESAAEFRRFTQGRLVAAKHTSAAGVLATLPEEPTDGAVEVPLDPGQAEQWLHTLNNIRLALGTRLDVQQDDDGTWDDLPPDDPRAAVHEIYQWLGWVQETLVASLRP